MSRRTTRALTVALLASLSHPAAEACGCLETPTEEFRERSSFVFRGVVLSKTRLREASPEKPGRERHADLYEFQIVEVFKGEVTGGVQVRTGECETEDPDTLCGNSCAVDAAVGAEYLVFATSKGQAYEMGSCAVFDGPEAERRANELRGRSVSKAPQNNALHQTRRGGAAASRPVVEARLAGERGCSADPGSSPRRAAPGK